MKTKKRTKSAKGSSRGSMYDDLIEKVKNLSKNEALEVTVSNMARVNSIRVVLSKKFASGSFITRTLPSDTISKTFYITKVS